MQLVARLAALEEENKNLKATVEEMRTPQKESTREPDRIGGKNGLGNHQPPRCNLLSNTGPILGSNDVMESPVRRLDTIDFDDDEDIENILADATPTGNDKKTSERRTEERPRDAVRLRSQRAISKLQINTTKNTATPTHQIGEFRSQNIEIPQEVTKRIQEMEEMI